VNGELIRISAAPGSGFIGFATAKKLGNRPQRNLQKRRVSEAVRIMNPGRDLRLDYVVIVTPLAKNATFARMQEEVRTLFDRALLRWVGELQSS
jgi:ribonuclease P protein component